MLSAAAAVADAVVVTGSPDDVQDAVDAVRGATRHEEGPVESDPGDLVGIADQPALRPVQRSTDLVAECRARFAAGADGCIAVMNGNDATEQFRQMERLGRELAR